MCLVPKKRKQCFTLAKGEKPLAMFIENRVKEILMEKYISFRYIVLEQNPAYKRFSCFWDQAVYCVVPWFILTSEWWVFLARVELFFNLDSEVLNQIQSDIRENKETGIIAGVNKQNRKETKSLFRLNENQYSSLWKSLHISFYILRFIKHRVWNQINVNKQQQFYEHKLLMAIFDNLKQSISTAFQEIKLLPLL